MCFTDASEISSLSYIQDLALFVLLPFSFVGYNWISLNLSDDPLAILVLDGSALRVFLDDEDDFAMLSENLFTDLDVDDRGKLSKKKIQDALVLMGVEMGVPTFSGWSFNVQHNFICK